MWKTGFLICLAKNSKHEPSVLHGCVFSQLTVSVEPTSSNSQSAETRRTPTMDGDFINVGKALKLFPYFKGNKQEVLAFIGNVDMAFTVINPVQEDVLCKFVLTWISGKPRTAVKSQKFR